MQSVALDSFFKTDKLGNRMAAGVEWEETQGKLESSHLDEGSNSGKEKEGLVQEVFERLVFCDGLWPQVSKLGKWHKTCDFFPSLIGVLT